MQSNANQTLRRFRGPALVVVIALCLMAAALAIGIRASADTPPYPPPAPTSASVGPPSPTNGHESPKPATDSNGGLASTGFATATAVSIVAALLVGGGVLLYLGKRRPN